MHPHDDRVHYELAALCNLVQLLGSAMIYFSVSSLYPDFNVKFKKEFFKGSIVLTIGLFIELQV